MPNKNNGLFKLSTIFFAMLPALLSGLNNKAQARDFFDPSFISSLNGSDPSTTPDLSVFQTQNAQAPGDYRVDIMFNGRYLDTRTIKFVANNRASSDNREPALVPCLSLKALAEYGVRIKSFPELAEDLNGCANFSVIPDTKADFDFTAQRLNISIPQAALSTTAQGYIPPDQFDDGINALLVNYQFSGSNDMQANDEYYSLNLQSGLNVGPWRIRNLSTWNKNNGDAGDWDSAYLYMQRSIRSINSNLVMGESSSLSTIFDSVPFTGIQLATDTTMLPESMRGYAPIIRGIAKTNARVVIKQNGYQVYQTYVAPGHLKSPICTRAAVAATFTSAWKSPTDPSKNLLCRSPPYRSWCVKINWSMRLLPVNIVLTMVESMKRHLLRPPRPMASPAA